MATSIISIPHFHIFFVSIFYLSDGGKRIRRETAISRNELLYLRSMPLNNKNFFKVSVAKENSHLIYLPYPKKLMPQEISIFIETTF